MKRKLCAALCIGLAAGTAAACGKSLETNENTVYVKKDGTIIGASIEDFNEDYYDEAELEAYITESVDDYVALNGDGSVLLDRFQVEEKDGGKSAQLYLNYGTYIDYAQFNGVEMYAGQAAQAEEDGYELESTVIKVEKGETAGKADLSEALALDGAKVVILGEETTLKVDGSIFYVSDGNVEVTGKNTAKLHYDPEGEDAALAYVFYK